MRCPNVVNKKLFLVDADSADVRAVHVVGSYACIRAYFHLERRLRAYILSTYLPSMLVVLLSWVSFWIDLESVPARISLGILTMLTITTQSSGQGRFPAVSFTKAIDVWMATCLVFVFGAFIEYSIVNVLARREKIDAVAISKASTVGAVAQVSSCGLLSASPPARQRACV